MWRDSSVIPGGQQEDVAKHISGYKQPYFCQIVKLWCQKLQKGTRKVCFGLKMLTSADNFADWVTFVSTWLEVSLEINY